VQLRQLQSGFGSGQLQSSRFSSRQMSCSSSGSIISGLSPPAHSSESMLFISRGGDRSFVSHLSISGLSSPSQDSVSSFLLGGGGVRELDACVNMVIGVSPFDYIGQ
jgi:hypothetical protein